MKAWLRCFFGTLAVASVIYGGIMVLTALGIWGWGDATVAPCDGPYRWLATSLTWYWPGAIVLALGIATFRAIAPRAGEPK